MNKAILSLAAGLFLSFAVNAQNGYVHCATMDHLKDQMKSDPGLASRMQSIEQQTQQLIQHSANRTQSVITIPVVVHVLYNTSAQNISDAQVQAQISQLNLDYARANTDAGNTPAAFASAAVNTQVQFCLAQRDPSGNPTTGIIHKSTTATSFSTNDNAKHNANGGDDAWAAGSYLNLWSCNLGGGLLGYAQFPGGSAATDGVVILYSSVGSMLTHGTAVPYDLGRTATHEVGHWLNLYHIWGDDGGACTGTDQVSDTPNQGSENYGCPTYPHTDACSPSSPGVMFMNYMDYTDDACMNMFTAGQTTRIQATLAGARLSIQSSLGCTPPSGCGTASGLSASSITSTSATLNWGAVGGANSYNVQYRVVGTTPWTATTSTTNSKAISGLTASTNYEFQVQAVCSAATGTFSASGTFTTSPVAGSCGTSSGLSATSVTSSSATLNWGAVSGASTYNVQYRIVGTSTWSTGTSSTTSLAVSGLTASSNYEFQVQAVCSGTSGSFSASGTFTTSAVSACSDIYEPNNSRTAAATAPLNVDFTGLISPTGDNDYFKFTTTSPNTNIQLTLTNLPFDYDLRLYNSSGSTLTTSQNGGTTSELIKRNTTTAATYYCRVYGYSGANSATQCYTLHIATSSTAFRMGAGENQVNTSKLSEVFSINPNPAKEKAIVNFTVESPTVSTMKIMDLSGRLVKMNSVLLNEGFNSFEVSLTDVAKGIYFMEMTNGEEKLTQKFVVDK